MDPLTPSLLLKLALSAYALGSFSSLAAARRDQLANWLGSGCAAIAGTCGILASVLALAPGANRVPAAFELWPSLIPYVRLTIRLDPLSAYFLLIVSLLA